MKTWFTADLHLGHQRIIDLCNRPFKTVEEMNEELIAAINSKVSEKERLVILGDICMGKLEYSLPLLEEIRAAEIVLVPGNHDRWSLAYQHRGDAEEKRENFRLRYARDERFIVLADSAPSAWTFFQLSGEWQRLGDPWEQTLFSHYPYQGDSQGEDRAGFLRAEDEGAPIIHGHVHEEWRVRGRQFNVGMDVNNFEPVSEEELREWVQSLR